jgi:hypothetical protein
MKDWNDWNGFVVNHGIVAFHDARVFQDGWTTSEAGSVRVVSELFRNSRLSDWRIIDEVDSLVIVQNVNP